MVSLQAALESVYARVPLGVKLGLSAMQAVCDRVGNPERTFPTVHVAGTNGKGSVSSMVEAIARQTGKRTGLFTSPHLTRFAERIRIDGKPIDDAALLPLLERALREGPELTFFETVTLAGFLAFRAANVDVCVVEVGLGGRLDATNVIPTPRAAAITGIAFDHMDKLGDSLVEIASEKAGIAKPGLDIVLGPMGLEVREAIDRVARQAGATTSSAGEDAEAASFIETAKIGLAGAHQRANARVAYVLGRRLGASVDACHGGIANVSWPGRLETISTPMGPVLLDAAHNPDGIASLTDHLDSLRLAPARIAAVFGVLADKAWTVMQDRLVRSVGHRFYVAPEGRAAIPAAALASRHLGEVPVNLGDALARARVAAGDGGLVVVTGSILLVGEARALLLGLPRDPPVGM